MRGSSGIAACGVPTLPQSSSSQTTRRSSRPFSRNFSAVGSSAARLRGDEQARAGIRDLVRQRDLAVERREMRDAGAGLQRAEEIDGMVRRVAEEQRDGSVLAAAGAQERGGRALGHGGELGIADRTIAEFQRGARAVIGGGVRQAGQAACPGRWCRPNARLRDKTVRRDGSLMSCIGLSEQLTETVIPGRGERSRARNP